MPMPHRSSSTQPSTTTINKPKHIHSKRSCCPTLIVLLAALSSSTTQWPSKHHSTTVVNADAAATPPPPRASSFPSSREETDTRGSVPPWKRMFTRLGKNNSTRGDVAASAGAGAAGIRSRSRSRSSSSSGGSDGVSAATTTSPGSKPVGKDSSSPSPLSPRMDSVETPVPSPTSTNDPSSPSSDRDGGNGNDGGKEPIELIHEENTRQSEETSHNDPSSSSSSSSDNNDRRVTIKQRPPTLPSHTNRLQPHNPERSILGYDNVYDTYRRGTATTTNNNRRKPIRTRTQQTPIHDPYPTRRIADTLLTGVQFGIVYYLVKSAWKTFVEAWEEVLEEGGSGTGRGGVGSGRHGGGTIEEHDVAFLNGDLVDRVVDSYILLEAAKARKELGQTGETVVDGETDAGAEKGTEEEGSTKRGSAHHQQQQQPQQPQQQQHQRHKRTSTRNRASIEEATRNAAATIKGPNAPLASDLAQRLFASGMPLSFPPTSPLVSSRPSVRTVLKSLTRTEGHLLSSTLLSPFEGYDDLYGDDDDQGNEEEENEGDDDEEEDPTAGLKKTRRTRIVERMWNDIGGLDDVKESLMDLVFPMLLPPPTPTAPTVRNEGTRSTTSSSYYGGLLSNPSGVLLYGPPGCGKTKLVRALAHTANARFLCVTPSTLLRKYVGETNLNVRALFSLAKKLSPCIIFVDEMEGLFRERSGGGGPGESDVNRELKTEFMQLWDGIRTTTAASSSSTLPQILIVGATNRPFDVDPAFLRRTPRSFYVGLPNHSSRVAVLMSMLRDVPVEPGDFCIDCLARNTEGYSPSDLEELLRTAALGPLREARAKAAKEWRENGGRDDTPHPMMGGMLRPLRNADLIRAREKVAPTRFSPQYKAALAEYSKTARNGGVEDGVISNSSDRPRSMGGGVAPYPQNHHIGNGNFYTDIGTINEVSSDQRQQPKWFHNGGENMEDEEDDEESSSEEYDDEDSSSSSYYFD